jgi:hypothetical protein
MTIQGRKEGYHKRAEGRVSKKGWGDLDLGLKEGRIKKGTGGRTEGRKELKDERNGKTKRKEGRKERTQQI